MLCRNRPVNKIDGLVNRHSFKCTFIEDINRLQSSVWKRNIEINDIGLINLSMSKEKKKKRRKWKNRSYIHTINQSSSIWVNGLNVADKSIKFWRQFGKHIYNLTLALCK